MTTSVAPYGIFSVYGIELEYMIVDRNTLDILPIADRVLKDAGGGDVFEAALGDVGWSNELVMHVLEMKTNGPAAGLKGLSARFHQHIQHANRLLLRYDACLLPSGMHPWMDPGKETHIWPHEQNEIYRAYDRIFGVRGHGWSNLQSTHINLPFGDEEEFARLHAAIRLILPLIPAIAAASPFVEGVPTGLLDTRLHYYSRNQQRIPAIAGRVIPEAIHSFDQYDERILKVISRDIAPHDPARILQPEWLNSRGAIARFERGAIEIRLIDVQECPATDMAIAALITQGIRALFEERWFSIEKQHGFDENSLADILAACIKTGEDTPIYDRSYARLFSADALSVPTAGALWRSIAARLQDEGVDFSPYQPVLGMILQNGTLAGRLLRAYHRMEADDEPSSAFQPANGQQNQTYAPLSPSPQMRRLRAIYQKLAGCLADNTIFEATSSDESATKWISSDHASFDETSR